MPDANQPVEASSEASKTIGRAERLERHRQSTPPVSYHPIVFSYAGVLSGDVESPPWYPEINTVLIQVRVSITVAAAGDNTVEVRLDGAPIEQHTLSAGDTTQVDPISLAVLPGQALTVKTIAVSGSDLSVIFRARAR